MTYRVLKWNAFYPDVNGMIGTFPKGKVVLVAPMLAHCELPTLWIEHEVEAIAPVIPNVGLDEKTDIPTDRYLVVGTGHSIHQEEVEHVGSCICANGALVWHVYKVVA